MEMVSIDKKKFLVTEGKNCDSDIKRRVPAGDNMLRTNLLYSRNSNERQRPCFCSSF